MNPISLLTALAQRPLLCDGAMGTQLQARGLQPGECGEAWNVTAPGRVSEVHGAYAAAGCDLITTNTFRGTSVALGRHGAAERVADYNTAGAKLARAAAGPGRWALGDMGPLGELLEPWGEMSPAVAYAAFAAQATALRAGGAHALLVETMSDAAEAAVAITAGREAAVPLIVATFAFQKAGGEFRTMMGATVRQCAEAALRAGAGVVGANCGTNLSLADYVQLGREFVAVAEGCPVIVQPNAGSPRLVEGRPVYDESAAGLAGIVPALLDAGVRIVGGCCGTTPEHLTAMRAAMR